jgi:hypothetical protein
VASRHTIERLEDSSAGAVQFEDRLCDLDHGHEPERRIARRGPSPDAPALSASENARSFDRLRVTAERSLTDREVDEGSGTLLRRNVYYPLSWHRSSDTAAWLEEMKQREEHRLGRLDTWSPRWVAARSLAVARARQGDQEPLRQFIRTARSSDACQAAGLNYDAYWIGATPETYRSDEFMARDLAPWVGETLLCQLAANLVAADPLADLYVHSTWALLQRRGSVLEGDPKLAAALLVRTEALLAEGDLSAQSRRPGAITVACGASSFSPFFPTVDGYIEATGPTWSTGGTAPGRPGRSVPRSSLFSSSGYNHQISQHFLSINIVQNMIVSPTGTSE